MLSRISFLLRITADGFENGSIFCEFSLKNYCFFGYFFVHLC